MNDTLVRIIANIIMNDPNNETDPIGNIKSDMWRPSFMTRIYRCSWILSI